LNETDNCLILFAELSDLIQVRNEVIPDRSNQENDKVMEIFSKILTFFDFEIKKKTNASFLWEKSNRLSIVLFIG